MVFRIVALLMVIASLGQVLAMQPAPLSQDQPILQVSPTSLSFWGQVGGFQPDPQYLTIANVGGGIMEWRASADEGWIILGGTRGKLSGGRAIQLLVWVDIEGLEAGEYQGTVTISSPNAQGSPVYVTVTLTLTTPPRLEVSPTSLSFQAEEGGPNPKPQTIRIRNAGGGILSWEATTDADWLTLGADRGSLAAGQNVGVGVFVDISSLIAGNYQGRIMITALEVQGNPAVVTVVLELEPKPEAKPLVCSSGCSYSSIAQAIAAARDGDTITIGPGTYGENLTITKNLTLRGQGPGETIIEGIKEGYPVILISGKEISIKLEGLKITGAKGGVCAAVPLSLIHISEPTRPY